MTPLLRDFRAAACTATAEGTSLVEAHSMMCEFRDRGLSQADALRVLGELRASSKNEVVEDRVLDLLDLATGWCSASLRVWTSSPE